MPIIKTKYKKFYKLKRLVHGLDVASWLLVHRKMVLPARPEDLTFVFSERWKLFVTHRGVRSAIYDFKESRIMVLRYLSGRPILEHPDLALTYDGIPIWLQIWIPIIRKKDPHALRLLTSFLFLGRLLKVSGPVDFSTIEHESQVVSDDIITSKEIGMFVSWVGGVPDLVTVATFLRSSMGPSQKGMLGLLREASGLGSSLYESGSFLLKRHGADTKLSSMFAEARILGEQELDYYQNGCPLKDNDLSCVRRLSEIVDKEGKMRVIAIFDYWSQLALKPLHETLNGILRGIKYDCTFDQDKFTRLISPSDIRSYSFDLKAATDLLPMHLQKRFIAALFGDEYAGHWSNIMVGSSFASSKGPVFYKTGQPMGAYSSWPTMALTHHLIVFVSYMRTSKKSPLKYTLLGDDLVIQGEEHALSYRKIVDDLGMEVSDVKTFDSFELIEFAKRLLFQDSEITPFPIGTVIDSKVTIYMISEAFKAANKRGWCDIVLTRTTVLQLLKALGIRKKRRVNYLIEKLINYHNTLIPFTSDWENDFETALSRWIKPQDFNLGCSTSTEFKKQFLMEAYASMKSDFIHSSVRSTVQNFNTLVPTLGFGSPAARNIILYLLNNIAKQVLIESHVQPDESVIPDLFRQMCEVDTNKYLPMPIDISTIFLGTLFEKRTRSSGIINDRYMKVLLSWNDSRNNLLREQAGSHEDQ